MYTGQTRDAQAAIRAHDLTRSLRIGERQIHILRGLSFEITHGEWIALTGPSGSGKSTLLGLLAGIDTLTGGQLVLEGLDISRMRESRLARVRNQKVGIVFQSFHLSIAGRRLAIPSAPDSARQSI